MMNLKKHRFRLAFVASTLLVIFACMNGFTQQAMLTGSAIGIQQGGAPQGAATILNCSTNVTCGVANGIATLVASGGGGGSAGASLFSATASKTVTATSATTLIGAVTGSTTVPVNTFTAGSVTQIFAQGYYSTPVTPASLTIDLLIGGSVRVSTGVVVQIASVTLGTWRLNCLVTTRATGSSGTQIANCIFEGTGATLTAGESAMQTSSAWTIDTTATQAIDVQATWSTATGSPTITCTNVAAWIPGAPVTSVFGQTGAVDIPITTTDISTPSNPASGKTKSYSKAGTWCSLDPTGTETCTGGSGGSSNIIGTANFNPSSGSIASLYTSGQITGVTYTSTGKYAVTLSGTPTNYEPIFNTAGLVHVTVTQMTAAPTNTGFSILVNDPSSGVFDPPWVGVVVVKQ